MLVRTREHIRNEGSRRFKSAPLHQRGIANRLSGLRSGPRVNGEAISAAPKAVMDISVEAKPQAKGALALRSAVGLCGSQC